MLTRPCIASLALAALASPSLAEPFDKCGAWVNGLEGCVVFQPDDNSNRVRPDIASPAVGQRARIRGELINCASFCFVACIQNATATSCAPPVCRADFDGSGTLAPADIFAYLGAWFAGSLSADYDNSGALAVQDIFAFINSWFAGCP